MRIVSLIENTEGRSGCAFAHGLSFYVETARHRLVLDLGPSGETVTNANALGIDLRKVDTVVLSHGHYDHAGGILPFTELNEKAPIYMQASAADDYYADDGKDAPVRYRYIGIDKRIAGLPQVRLIRGNHRIDEELSLFTLSERSHPLPSTNRRILVRRDGSYLPDDFLHEQYLVIREGGKSVLLSGCAHNGILSILDGYRERFGSWPDLVVSGFHLMKKKEYTADELAEIEDIAEELSAIPTRFVTCHCTGLPAFEKMKSIMGDGLSYLHSGEEIAYE